MIIVGLVSVELALAETALLGRWVIKVQQSVNADIVPKYFTVDAYSKYI